MVVLGKGAHISCLLHMPEHLCSLSMFVYVCILLASLGKFTSNLLWQWKGGLTRRNKARSNPGACRRVSSSEKPAHGVTRACIRAVPLQGRRGASLGDRRVNSQRKGRLRPWIKYVIEVGRIVIYHNICLRLQGLQRYVSDCKPDHK